MSLETINRQQEQERRLLRFLADWEKLLSFEEQDTFLRNTIAKSGNFMLSQIGKSNVIYRYLQSLSIAACENKNPAAIKLLTNWIYSPEGPNTEEIQAAALWLLARTGHFGKYKRAVTHLCESKQGWKVIDFALIKRLPASFFSDCKKFPSLSFLDLDKSDAEEWSEFYDIHKDPKPWEKGLEMEIESAKKIFDGYFTKLDKYYHGGWDPITTNKETN